ncbi:hypothetical protein A1D29_10825 [Pasteurellaceae bacterium Orientalotternb1]|nr:hypothetical protein A1D29_10825 [Pasteurellaceae bacterium Orientalotternb1]
MKKLALTALLGFVSTAAFAAPVGQTFTGFGAGVDITSTKYKESGISSKRATGFGLVADYGFDYGNNLVGLVEGKLKLNTSTLIEHKTANYQRKISEQWRLNVSYLQGYRVLPDLLPYVKVSYVAAKFKGEESTSSANHSYSLSKTETGSGLGLGLGVKYAVSTNFEVGAEYLRTRTKFDSVKINGNTFGANLTYRF